MYNSYTHGRRYANFLTLRQPDITYTRLFVQACEQATKRYKVEKTRNSFIDGARSIRDERVFCNNDTLRAFLQAQLDAINKYLHICHLIATSPYYAGRTPDEKCIRAKNAASDVLAPYADLLYTNTQGYLNMAEILAPVPYNPC